MTERKPSPANLKLARQTLADWRPPTDEQLDRIAMMLDTGPHVAEVVPRK